MRLKRENKGFSLVELIVVIAIFSVVSIAIGGFMLAAHRSYAVSANELDIQEEAQLVANQLQEMVLDAALGISYQYVVVDDTGAELIDFMTDEASVALPAGDLTKKELYIYGKDYYYHIYWNKDTSELYFVEYEKIGATPQLADGMTSSGVLLGEYISDFSVDLSRIATERIVSFDITFKKSGDTRDYTVSRNVSIRNNILMNKPTRDVYDAVGLEFEPVADNLDVSPSSAFIWPGETKQLSILATCSRGGVPSQDVSWSYSSGDGVPLDAETKVNASGVFKAGANEQSTIVNMVASMPGKDYDTDTDIVLTKAVTMNVIQIQNLSVIRNDFATMPISPNGLYTVDVKITGTHLAGAIPSEVGGVEGTIEMGNSFASIVDKQDVGSFTTRFTIQLSSGAPTGGDIAMSFHAERAGFTDVTTTLGIYKVGNVSNEVLTITSDTGTEWNRLSSSKVLVDFADPAYETTYCDASGNLKTDYFIRYTYEVYDSNYVKKRTAYKSTGSNGNAYTDYFSSVGSHTSQTSSVMQMTDKVFITSGTVVVRADLMHKTAGSPVVVGSSDSISYTIPQVGVGFRRAAGDTPASNLTVYITKNVNSVPIYIACASGYATNDYSLNRGYMQCTPNTLADVSNVDLSNRKIIITGSDTAEYENAKNNVVTFNYGGLPNNVTIKLVEPNLAGTDYYVPLNNSEWSIGSKVVNGTNITQYYIYYMDDTHKMDMIYYNGTFLKATYSILKNNVWEKVADYSMNRVTTGWDVLTP